MTKQKGKEAALVLFDDAQQLGVDPAIDHADAAAIAHAVVEHDDRVDASAYALRIAEQADRSTLLRLVEARGLAWVLGQLADDCTRQSTTANAPLAGKLRLVGLSLRYLGERGEGPVVVERR